MSRTKHGWPNHRFGYLVLENLTISNRHDSYCGVVGHLKKTMKHKNYKSAIHNFTHSFISIDYTKSGLLAVNVLIDLHNLGLETKTRFDFINKSIQPTQAESKGSKQLLNDYLDWLPEHFENHNCDLTKLEKLETIIWVDFDKAFSPPSMNDAIEFTVNTVTKWKADGRDEEIIEISQTELIKKTFLKLRIPEMK